MSWLGNLFGFGKEKTDDVRTSSNGITYLGDNLFSPAKMNAKQALAISTVYACVNILGETIGSLKVEVLKKEGKNTAPATEHPLHHILGSQPNKIYSSFSFFETGTISMKLKGNTYAYINTNRTTGKIESLDLLDAEQMVPFIAGGKLFYRDLENQITYLPDEIIHVPNMSLDGINGITPLQYVVDTIGGAKKSRELSANILANGAFVGGVLESDQTLNPAQEEKLVKSWANAYSGTGNSGKTAVLENGLKYKQVRMKPTDIELLKSMEYSDKDVARVFRVPLHLLQSLERSTNNNIEQQSIDFVVHTVRPIVKRWEAELNRKLFSEEERKKYFVRFNIDSLLRGDVKSRAAYYKDLFMIGALSQNDIRAHEKLNPIEGGDKYYVMINMADSATGQQIGNNEQKQD